MDGYEIQQPPSGDLIAFAIVESFGERCATYDADCYTCQAWSQYDRLSAQQREPVVREQKFSKIMHQIALWPEDSARSSSGK